MPSESLRDAQRRALLRQLAALGLTAQGGVFASTSRAAALRVGAAAPPATLVTLDGNRIATADLLGRVVLLTFWATWCAPCRQELPLLSTYATLYAERGLTILGFSLDAPEDLPRVRKMAQALSFPSGLVAVSSLQGYGRIWHIPVNFTIDRKGLLYQNGWDDKDATWTAERFSRIVLPLLT
jgi:cytochrome c biogenesis protein CcmG, thiol:disulfide interchange protein DsbE